MAFCRDCNTAITWVTDEQGRNMPVDEAPTKAGNLVIIKGVARLATDEDRKLLRPLFAAHWKTCTSAPHWRRRRL
jgi:hypothetical protein